MLWINKINSKIKKETGKYKEHCEFVNEAECEEEMEDADAHISNEEYWEDE